MATMATLSRVQYAQAAAIVDGVDRGIPSPFPIQALRESRSRPASVASGEDGRAVPRILVDPVSPRAETPVGREQPAETQKVDTMSDDVTSVTSAIADLQLAVVSALQHILVSTAATQTTLISRRHSMPSRTSESAASSSELHSPLRNLVTQLMATAGDNDDMHMLEIPQGTEALTRELRRQIQAMEPYLDRRDFQLANALCSLTSDMARVDELTQDTLVSGQPSEMFSLKSPSDVYDSLQHQISRLQSHQVEAQSLPLADHTSVNLVERELLWSRVDSLLADIRELCREPTDPFASGEDRYSYSDGDSTILPPSYEQEHGGQTSHLPPSYEPSSFIYTSYAEKPKRSLELDDIAEAIAHFNRTNPQLVDQRFVMNQRGADRMEMAKLIGAVEKLVNTGRLDDQRAVAVAKASVKGKEREGQGQDDSVLWDLIEKSSSRRLESQQVEIGGGMEARLAKANMKERAKRDAFMTTLVQKSSSGRLTSQDAVMRPSVRDPNALLTFPEFMRESAKTPYPHAAPLLHPELRPELAPPDPTAVAMIRKGGRDRSLSAPPLAWLTNGAKQAKVPSPEVSEEKAKSQTQFAVHYVAEHRAQLNAVQLTFMLDGLPPKSFTSVTVEVLSDQSNDTSEGSQRVLLKCTTGQAAILKLPTSVAKVKQVVKPQGECFDLKLKTLHRPEKGAEADSCSAPQQALLDGPTLAILSPTSYTCASCSLPLVTGSAVSRYDDLPSEYWNELVDAWMCHADQHVPTPVASEGGLVPRPGQALVGGSYILFEQGAALPNIRHKLSESKDGAWTLLRCVCGHVVGRARQDTASCIIYRLTKYRLRLMGTKSEPPHVPISAYVVQDMVEHVEAHAAYHFVIRDDQEDQPRILAWLFNPSVDITWSVRKSYFLPREGACRAAIIFFRIIGPSQDPAQVLKACPDFNTAEHLSYPIDVCRRLAALLKESHGAYPGVHGKMKGLDKGWLARA